MSATDLIEKGRSQALASNVSLLVGVAALSGAAIVYFSAQAVPDLEAKARYLESFKKQRATLGVG